MNIQAHKILSVRHDQLLPSPVSPLRPPPFIYFYQLDPLQEPVGPMMYLSSAIVTTAVNSVL